MNKKYDIIIIGSGAAGSVMAFQLIRENPGLKIAVLERGKRQNPQSFEHDTLEMLAKLYKNGGMQTTKDNDITIAQGETVGGTTVVNNAIWIRPDVDKVLNEWVKNDAYIDKNELVAAYYEIEKALQVESIDPKMANAGSEFFLKGCKKLNIEAEYLKHNRTVCIGCGWCNYGCKYNRKTSMLVTFLAWAEQRGVEIIDGCKDVNILYDSSFARNVEFIRKNEKNNQMEKKKLDSDKVIICAGAIGSSEVLLRSKINPNGRTGKNFHALGGILVSAEMPVEINGYDKIGLTCIAHASPDYLIENFFSPPSIFSLSLSGWFHDHFKKMLKYNYYAQAGVMTATKPVGEISLNKKGEVVIDLTFSKREIERLKRGLETTAKIFFAAGAKKVIPATYRDIEFENVDTLINIDRLIKKADDLIIGSAHPQGGNIMSDNSNFGVVDSQFKVHGFENIYVADASVFPSNIMANCQATVMAISRYASKRIL